MTELFVVWITTAGVFGLSAHKNAEGACNQAQEKRGQVFKMIYPNSVYAMVCVDDPDCNFPGWQTVPVTCEGTAEVVQIIPAHWEIKP